MPTTYFNKAVGNLIAYGYGDTKNGVSPYIPQYEGFQEYLVHKHQSFFIETGSLYIPAYSGDQNGFYITYCNPGWSYRARNVFRPTWVPFRKDFFSIVGQPDPPTLQTALNHFKYPGEVGHTELDRVVFGVKAAGFISWGRRTYFNNDFREMLIGANGKFTVQYVTFPYTNPNNPNPGKNYDGVQVGKIIKFFTEDEFSIIVFEDTEDIRASMNTLP